MSEKETGAKKSFEDRLQQVQDLTARIESGAMPLEDSVKEFERGEAEMTDENL